MPVSSIDSFQYMSVNKDAGDEEDDNRQDIRPKRYSIKAWILVAVLYSTILSGSVGFVLGRVWSVNSSVENFSERFEASPSDTPIHLDHVMLMFEPNRSFLERPSRKSNELWETLFPLTGHGLFGYPDEKPERSGFAGFHQLHCVNSLRMGYYQAEEVKAALIQGYEIPEFEHAVDERHTLHCIEVLRQSIICHADTTLQRESVYHQGIAAFGNEYRCRDWWQMVDWVNERNQRIDLP